MGEYRGVKWSVCKVFLRISPIADTHFMQIADTVSR